MAIKPWENIYRVVRNIFSASGEDDWIKRWACRLPAAVDSVSNHISRLTGDSEGLAQAFLDFVDLHHKEAEPSSEGSYYAMIKSLSPDDRSEFKKILWDLEQSLRDND